MSKSKSTFPITFKNSKSLMRFIGRLLEDEPIRGAIKLHIREIEDKQAFEKVRSDNNVKK